MVVSPLALHQMYHKFVGITTVEFGEPPFDCVCICSTSAESAPALGLGTLWIANTCFAYTELCDYLQTENQLVCAVAVGYAGETPSPRPRKKAEDIVEYRGVLGIG